MIAVDRIVRVITTLEPIDEVSNDLVAIEIEVDPPLRTSSFPASQHAPIEVARFVEIAHRKRKMKGSEHRYV